MRVLLLVTAVGCFRTPEAARPTAPPPADAAIAVETSRVDASGDAAVLGDADCRAFAAAGALAIATVASSTPDCSGIGNERIVLEVVRLARGANITKVVTSRPLYARQDPMAKGDTFILAVEPADRPAATVHCVPLPAHQGTVKHLVRVDTIAAAERALASCPSNER